MPATITVLGSINNIKQFDGNTPVTKFRVQDSFKNTDGTYTKVNYTCVVFGKRGDTIAQNFEEGSLIYVTGACRGITKRENKNTGEVYENIDIMVNDFGFMPRDWSKENKPKERVTSHEPEDLDFGS